MALTFEFDFNTGIQGWTGGVADYPASFPRFELPIDHRPLPAELAPSRSALWITTAGEGVTTFAKTRVTGLRADVVYQASFALQIATNTRSGCPGPGGAPGEGTRVAAGAFPFEPIVVTKGVWYRLNIDTLLSELGHIANSQPCTVAPRWEYKQLNSGTITMRVQPAADGSVWLLVGQNAQFFSGIEFYYTRFSATFTRE